LPNEQPAAGCPDRGDRFNAHKTLLDPYAKALTNMENWDLEACLGYDPGDEQKNLSLSRRNPRQGGRIKRWKHQKNSHAMFRKTKSVFTG
jgi:pullulanase/glycogen debranching enzyme